MKKVSMILLAGGIGNRMKQPVPKQHLMFYGKPLIMYILERIDSIESIEHVVITCPADYLSETKAIIEKYNLRKKYQCIKGGQTRQESVYLALQEVKTPLVLIHEAARPFVKAAEFQTLIENPAENAIYGTDIPFTVVQGGDYIENLLERSSLINVQLPQKFCTQKLLDAHKKARGEKRNFTEDASLLYEYTKEKVAVLKGTEFNIKITNPIDLKVGEVIYKHYIRGDE